MFSLMDTMEVKQSFPEPSPLLRGQCFISVQFPVGDHFFVVVTFVFH